MLSHPAGASLQLVPNSKFRIQNSQFSLHPPHITTAHCPPLFWRGGTGVRTPLSQACSLYPIQNSLYIPHTALLRTVPSLLERGNGGEDSAAFSVAAKVIFFGYIIKIIVPLLLEVTQKIGTIK